MTWLLRSILFFMTTLAFISIKAQTTTDTLSSKKSDAIEKEYKLDELTVTAHKTEIRQKGDTTIVDATAFKTPEGAYLEELIKRIPGLDYDRKTKEMKFQGKTISGINLNGELFFGGDIKKALENLTADVVSKIKIYDKRTELEKITGVDDGQENYILDLQTKAAYNGSILLDGQGGYGNHRKKDFTLNGNLFKANGENISIAGNSSNKNTTTDYPDNISNNIGLNFVKKAGDKLTFNGSLFYNRDKNGNTTSAYNEQYLTSGNLYQISDGNTVSESKNVNVYLGLRYELNAKTFLNLQGNFSLSQNANRYDSRNATFDHPPLLDYANPFTGFDNTPDSIRMNASTMQSTSSSHSTNYSINADFTRRLNERGSSVSVTFQLSGSEGKDESLSNSTTTYYRLQETAGRDSVLVRKLLQHSPTRSTAGSIGLMFTQPLSKKMRLQLSYALQFNKEGNDRSTYSPVEYVDSLSNRSRSSSLIHRINLRMNYSGKAWHMDGGLTVQPRNRTLDQKTGMWKADSTLHTIEYSPTMNIRWQKNDNNLSFMYYGNSSPAELSDLLSPVNYSNPLYVTKGNPDLKPSYNQSFNISFYNYKAGIFASTNFRNEYNSRTTSVTYNTQTAGRETMPVNVNGNWSIDGQAEYERRIKAFRLSGRINGTQSHRVGLMNDGTASLPRRSLTKDNRLNARMSAAWLPQWGSFELSGNWDYTHTKNDLQNSNVYTRNYDLGLDAFADIPGGFQLRTDMDYTFRNGTNITPGEDDQFVWNAELTWRFLRKKQAELSFYWADILSKRKNYIRTTTATGFYEQHSRQIGSYFLVSFKYRLNLTLKG